MIGKGNKENRASRALGEVARKGDARPLAAIGRRAVSHRTAHILQIFALSWPIIPSPTRAKPEDSRRIAITSMDSKRCSHCNISYSNLSYVIYLTMYFRLL